MGRSLRQSSAVSALFSFSNTPMHLVEPSSKRLGGIFTRKQRWGLSWRGRLIVVASAALALFLILFEIQPFLAVTHRIEANVLVVEGWVHEYAIRAGAEEFKTGAYERIFTTGGPVVGNGGYVNDYQTSASVGAGLLRKVGVPGEFVQMVPSRMSDRDRTYSSAAALREWFREHNMIVHSFNVVTEGTHGRRTRLLFEKAFNGSVTVGIIAVPSPDYDQRRWWRYSEGVQDVLNEAIAYIYAKLFFYPSESSHEEKGARTSQASR
jgi:uncharacterized SAM-binding protein YcdF (DUF218 family)